MARDVAAVGSGDAGRFRIGVRPSAAVPTAATAAPESVRRRVRRVIFMSNGRMIDRMMSASGRP
jgi:hypothetical protein